MRKSDKGSRKKRAVFRELAVVATGAHIGPVAEWSMEIVSPQGWTVRSRQTLSVEDMVRLFRERGC